MIDEEPTTANGDGKHTSALPAPDESSTSSSALIPIPRNHKEDIDKEDDSEQYIRNCDRYGMKVDPSVVISLRTEWAIMQPTKGFCEGYLLPLAGILDHNTYIRRMNLSGTGVTNVKATPGNGDSNARVLHQVLSSNTTIDTLDLSNMGMDDFGIAEICEGLKKNSAVTTLSVARNSFTRKGVAYIEQMLGRNNSLKYLDISRNALGFHSINKLQCCCAAKRLEMKVEGNYVFEEIMNSLTHGIGFVVSVVGTILLVSAAAVPHATPYHFWSCMIFSLSLMMLYLSSTLYHSFFMLPYAKDILQIFDHVGIYLLIAGSYSPFMMIALHHNTSANVLLVVEWVTALIGICVSIGTSGIGCSSQATNFVEVIIFVAMGCAAICIWDQLVVALPTQALYLLVSGGLAYIFGIIFFILGIIFFILGEIKPIFHTVWHVFVMIGSFLHWFCIYHYIVSVDIMSLTP